MRMPSCMVTDFVEYSCTLSKVSAGERSVYGGPNTWMKR